MGGQCHRSLGNLSKAEEFMKRALDVKESEHGTEHPQYAMTLANLAEISGASGNAEKHREYLGRAVSILERRAGKEHPHTLRVRSALERLNKPDSTPSSNTSLPSVTY